MDRPSRRRLLTAGSGGTSIGPTVTTSTMRVIAASGMRQTLFNLARLRFGETPSFVAASQVVSGCTVQTTAHGNFRVDPPGAINSAWALPGSTRCTDQPSFTLHLITGDRRSPR